MASPAAVEKIKDVLRIQAGSSKVDVGSSTRSLYLLLSELLQELKTAKDQSFSFNELPALFDDIWQSKKIAFSSNLSAIFLAVVSEARHVLPGFVVRNIVTSAINYCNNKVSVPLVRECALSVLCILIRDRIGDCASQSMDAFQIASKLVKAAELGVRMQSLKLLQSIVLAGDGKLSDMYGEVLKVVQRTITDRSETVRELCVQIVRNLAEASEGFSIIQADILLALLSKPLEDESANVQASSAVTAAVIYELQIRAFVEKQEQAKIGAARGSDNAQAKTKAPSSMSRLSLAKFTTKKAVEEQNDFRTVIDNIIRLIQRSNDALRSGYLLTLGHLLQNYLDSIDGDDLDWVVLEFMTIPQDTAFQQLSFEEQTLWRTKISLILRSRVFAYFSEPKLIAVANALIKSCGGLESSSKSDLEMQLILEETNHVLNNLGPALIALRDEAITCATVNLRHSCFAVRVAAANILVTVSAAVPAVAIDFIRNAVNNARTQASQLASMDFTGEELSSEDDTNANTPSPRRKTAKEMEKLQRMYYFHGHAIVIAMILRNVTRIPDGLNYEEILQALDFGLSMMSNDLYAAPATSKNVLCSIIRAGALIVSSCISIGFEVTRLRLRQILDTCTKLFHLGDTDSQLVKPEELVYEVMCIESAVVCIYNLLQYSSESLALDATCLITVIDLLEVCFRNLKNKYQPVHRGHFRFRTLHVILLESFAMLPPGAYPNSCQQIYVEALRVYRDCISSGIECTSPLLENLLKDGPRNTDIQILFKDRICNESIIALKLDQHITILQKRETEAFLTLFGQDFQPCFAEETYLYDARRACNVLPAGLGHRENGGFKSSLIETRCLDTAIKLMAVTFSHQSSEYQDKAIQLFGQALAQVAPAPTTRMSLTGSTKSLSLFGNDEERKRKERKTYLVNKNVVSALHVIVDAFPVHSGEVVELDYQWRETLVDQLYSFLGVKDDGIRFAAAIALAKFSMKWRGYNVISSISQKIRGAIIPSLAKTATGDVTQFMEEFSGYVPALGYLWSSAAALPDVRSLVTTTLFDCTRKTDASIHFLSLVMAALACICESHLQVKSLQSPDASSEANDFLEKVAYVVESTQALVSNLDEEESLALESVSLLGYALALALHYDLSAELKLRLQKLLGSVGRDRNNTVRMDMAWIRTMHVVLAHDKKGEYVSEAINALRICKQESKLHLLDSCLDAIVGIAVSLADFHPQSIVKELSVDYLFELYESALNHVCASSVLDQRGIEIRSESIDVYRSGQYKSLMVQIEKAIQAVIVADVQSNADQHLTYWVLYLRSVAMGLGKPSQAGSSSQPYGSAGNGAGDGGGRDEDDAEEGGGGGVVGEIGASEKAGGTGNANRAETESADVVYLSSITSISQLGTVYREYLLKSCPYLPFGRIEIKAAAIRLATKLVQYHLSSSPNLTDIGSARQRAWQALQEMRQASPTCAAKDFVRMNIPISLYLNDLVNLGCSIATYTLNDKTIPSLQQHGMQFLAEVCRLFATATDPDYQSQGSEALDAVESKLLLQFLSQLSGAVRVCLSVRHVPVLLQETVKVLCLLLAHGFIRDKVALKRLLKPVSSYFEEVLGQKGQVRPSTGGVHETIATQEMLVMLKLLGHIRLLTVADANISAVVLQDKNVLPSIDSGVRTTLAGFVQEIGDKFFELSHAVLTDALRMFMAQQQPQGSEEDALIKELHPLRGGLTYSPSVHILILQEQFMETAMVVALALTQQVNASDSVTAQFMDVLLATVNVVFEFCGSSIATVGSAFYLVELQRQCRVDLTLLISQLCLRREILTNSSHCLSLLTKLQALSHQSSTVSGPSPVNAPLVCRIIVNVLQQQPANVPMDVTILQSCWLSALSLTQTIVPMLFTEQSNSNEVPLLNPTQCVSHIFDQATSSQSLVVSNDLDSTTKECIVCWLVLASKILSLSDDNKGLKESGLAYVARLLSLLTIEYGIACQRFATSHALTRSYGAMFDTCVKAYGKTISLLRSADQVQCELKFLIQVIWRGYQRFMSISSNDNTAHNHWESVLEIATILWNMGVSSSAEIVANEPASIPVEFIAIALNSASSKTAFASTIAVATRLLQLPTASVSLRQWWIPPYLSAFASDNGDEGTRILYLRFFLIACTTAGTATLPLLQVFLPILCDSITREQQILPNDTTYLLVTGGSLTHIARLAAEDFKSVVAGLSEANKSMLQLAMRTAILQEQQKHQMLQNQQQHQGGSTASGGIKINMDRYKK
jgi:hypothetical protein